MELTSYSIDWGLMATSTSNDDHFALVHPDLNPQNIFTSRGGTITGIINWDWVAAVSRSVGCLKPPFFLMKDFNAGF